MAADPFHCTIAPLPDGVIEIGVSGYLDLRNAESYLQRLDLVIDDQTRERKDPLSLLYVEKLSGFESLTVPRRHGAFFRAKAAQVVRVAIVSSKAAVTFGLAVAKLIASPKQEIKAFRTEDEARRWLAVRRSA